MKRLIFPFLVVVAMTVSPVSAHSGRTDASGCHKNKSTGEYHCHDNNLSKTARSEARTFAPGQSFLGTIICSYNAYNCSDFSHQDAQYVYEYCLSLVEADIHDLDRDRDGLACEK